MPVEQADGGATGPDTSCSTAFALGWETASLFRGGSFDSGRGEDPGDDNLPGLIGLSRRERTDLAIDLLGTKLRKLEKRLPDVEPVDPRRMEALRDGAGRQANEGGPLRDAVKDFHLEVLRTLTATELRLGRAYGLGHALADTCLRPTDFDSFQEAFGVRLIGVKDWLADLASSFPRHSSRAVVLSLRAWEAWAANPCIEGDTFKWERHGAGVRDALHRQGELWRDLLAGDKEGDDMLDTNHYLVAANSLIGKMASTLWHFLKTLRAPLLLAIAALCGGIALVLVSDTAGKAAGVVLAAAGAIGITGAGLRARLGRIAAELQSRLWGAELDLAIAEAVLIGPPGWNAEVKSEVPPTGTAPKVAENMAVLEDLREAIEAGKNREVRDLLAPNVELPQMADGEVEDPGKAAEWLLRTENAKRLRTEPQQVDAMANGALIVRRDGRFEVWRVQEEKVRRWECFEREREAREAAAENIR